MSLASLFGEETLNEHEMAWRSKDWDSVKKLADNFKEKPTNEFFYILNQINNDKRRINPDDIESYNQYAINSMLSKHLDCIQHVFNMNLIGDSISDQMHFDYLLHGVRPSKRYGGAGEIADPVEDMAEKVFYKCVAKVYEVSIERGKDYVDLLTYKEETAKIRYLKKTAGAMVTDAMIKEVCPYAKAADAKNVLKVMKEWVK